MKKSVLSKDILPFFIWFALLIISTIVCDYLLHQFQLVWVGKYLGISGTIILLSSFIYSLRKRRIIQQGSLKSLLKIHEYFAWFGTLLIMIHGGIHFNGLLPWFALFFMLLVLTSGLIGQYILKQGRKTLKIKYAYLLEKGISKADIEKKVFLDALTIKAMTKWRLFHKPITVVFAITTVVHIVTILMFWSWH